MISRFLERFSSHETVSSTVWTLESDLTRLAQLSPHLLSDLGFEEDIKARAPGRRIWRKDEYLVNLHTIPGKVIVQVKASGD